MRTFVFLDLDDTILQSHTRCPIGEPLQAVAVRRDGSPAGYMTDRQRHFFEMLEQLGTIIPVTGRSSEAFRRVHLAFPHAAVLAFGGVVLLPGGELDRAWDDHIRPQALAAAGRLEDALKEIEAFSRRRGLGIHARIVWDFEMPLYVVVKHPKRDAAALQAIAVGGAWPTDAPWFVHRNGNNLSLGPPFLGKEHAVAHVMERHLGEEPSLTIGVGDSLTDAAFLTRCDWALVPHGSQLHERLNLYS